MSFMEVAHNEKIIFLNIKGICDRTTFYKLRKDIGNSMMKKLSFVNILLLDRPLILDIKKLSGWSSCLITKLTSFNYQ